MRMKTLAMVAFLLAMSFGWSSAAPPDEVVNKKDGSTLVRIPGGEFRMGISSSDAQTYYQEAAPAIRGLTPEIFACATPDRVVTMGDYYIGKYLVTNAQFAAFVAATGYKTYAERRPQDFAGTWRHPQDFKAGPSMPVVLVTWGDATAYCTWAGGRLPTEEEWEKAARGTDGRAYPWGETWDASRCQCSHTTPMDAGGPATVNAHPTGASPYGCLDMAGNVNEWTDSWFQGYPGTDFQDPHYGTTYRVLRGGSWITRHSCDFRTSYRDANVPDAANPDIGFRVACSSKP